MATTDGIFGSLLIALTFTLLLWNGASLFQNYRSVRRTGLPLVVVPWSELNPLWINWVWVPALRHIVNNLIPQSLADYINDNAFTSRYWVKDRRFKKLGGLYFTVSPGNIILNVRDADVISEIAINRARFLKPAHQTEVMNLYGPSIVTCDDNAWPHHKRYTAGAFNEKINLLVWKEALHQCEQMLQNWSKNNKSTSSNTIIVERPNISVTRLALHVISLVALGIPLSFLEKGDARDDHDTLAMFSDTKEPPKGYTMTYRASMEFITSHITSVIGAIVYLPSWLNIFMRKQFSAHEDLGNYLQSIFEIARKEETEGITRTKTVQNSLVGLMARYSLGDTPAGASSETGGSKVKGFTAEEAIGNLFLFTIAGHESTATTIRYALVNVAIHREIQDWLCTEIDKVLADQPADTALWSYKGLFPKLVAPLCVMLETLRLYPPVVSWPKWTGDSPQPITHEGTTYMIPAKTNININVIATHLCTDNWGLRADVFDPTRWDASNPDSFLARNKGIPGLVGPGLESDLIHRPKRGSFVPFSEGFRACMGRKFSQAEFVAVITMIFSKYNVLIAKKSGENDAMAEKRARAELSGSRVGLTLMTNEELGIELVPREK